MKINILISFLTAILLYSCTPDNPASSANPINNFSGSYRGTVVDSINGSYHSTISDYTIILVGTNTQGQYSLTNNLILTNTGKVNGNTFTIPLTTATQNSSMIVKEWANGTFTGFNNSNWDVTFYQNQIDVSTGSVYTRLVRKCTLVKQ